MNEISTNVSRRNKLMTVGIVLIAATLMMTFVFAFAAPQQTVPGDLQELLENMVFYVGLIFQAVGILLGIYAVGQMIMAFKDENPDAKAKAATLLVVSVILVVMPSIIENLDLISKLGSKN